MLQITDFTSEWIPQAEELILENYVEERNLVPSLPEQPKIPSLLPFVENGMGVAAIEGDRLLGFLCAGGVRKPVFCTPDTAGVFSPLHAHGVTVKDQVRIWRRLYQAAAEKWVRAGAVSHTIMLYAHDAGAREALYSYGFGMRCMDLMRPLALIACLQADGFYELPADQHDRLYRLRRGLSDHLEQSPCFMQQAEGDFERWLERKMRQRPRVFCAEQNGEIIAYIEVGGEGENFLSETEGTANISGAFCLPEYRGTGLMAHLLQYVCDRLAAEGRIRLGVDCESFNPTALGFWSKHFDVYTHSVVRRIDENILL